MTSAQPDHERLLRWYPSTWRDRYGEELLALIDDECGDEPPTPQYRRALARAGVRERVYASGLLGHGGDASTRLRSGSLLVLCTWALFVVGGLGLQKTSEHFAQAMPLASRASSTDAFTVVTVFALISVIALSIGVTATLPAVASFLRSGGWPRVRRHVLRSVIASVILAATLVPLSLWAHHLDEFQRNGGDGTYSWTITVWAVLVTFTLASWTVTAIAVARRLSLSRAILRVEGAMAIVVTISMAAITGATAFWWDTVSRHASWFLNGDAVSTSSTSVSTTMVGIVSVMSIAVLCAVVGVVRIASSWRHCASAPTSLERAHPLT